MSSTSKCLRKLRVCLFARKSILFPQPEEPWNTTVSSLNVGIRAAPGAALSQHHTHQLSLEVLTDKPLSASVVIALHRLSFP